MAGGLGDIFMSANHIAAQGGGFEPQRRNNGALYIFGLEAYGNLPESGASVLTLSQQSVSTPTVHLDPIELPFMNQARRVAGRANVDMVEAQFTDYFDRATMSVLLNWHLAVYDPMTGRVGLARDYKKNAMYVLFAPDGGALRAWQWWGVFPTAVNIGQLDMADNSQNLVDVTLSVDNVMPLPGGFVAGITRKLLEPSSSGIANLIGAAGAIGAAIG